MEFCPNGCDLTGTLIAEESRHLYGKDFYSRKIGIEVQGLYDGVCFWRCPDCGVDWLREGLPERVGRWFQEHHPENTTLV